MLKISPERVYSTNFCIDPKNQDISRRHSLKPLDEQEEFLEEGYWKKDQDQCCKLIVYKKKSKVLHLLLEKRLSFQ